MRKLPPWINICERPHLTICQHAYLFCVLIYIALLLIVKMIEEEEIGVEESVAEGIEEEVEVQARLVKAKEVGEELHPNAGFLSQISHSK